MALCMEIAIVFFIFSFGIYGQTSDQKTATDSCKSLTDCINAEVRLSKSCTTGLALKQDQTKGNLSCQDIVIDSSLKQRQWHVNYTESMMACMVDPKVAYKLDAFYGVRSAMCKTIVKRLTAEVAKKPTKIDNPNEPSVYKIGNVFIPRCLIITAVAAGHCLQLSMCCPKYYVCEKKFAAAKAQAGREMSRLNAELIKNNKQCFRPQPMKVPEIFQKYMPQNQSTQNGPLPVQSSPSPFVAPNVSAIESIINNNIAKVNASLYATDINMYTAPSSATSSAPMPISAIPFTAPNISVIDPNIANYMSKTNISLETLIQPMLTVDPAGSMSTPGVPDANNIGSTPSTATPIKV